MPELNNQLPESPTGHVWNDETNQNMANKPTNFLSMKSYLSTFHALSVTLCNYILTPFI